MNRKSYREQVDMGQRCDNCGQELREHWSIVLHCLTRWPYHFKAAL